MPCSVAGHTQPSAVLHLSGSAGPPQDRNSLPFESNSMTDGAGRQQSPSAPYGRGKPSTSTGFPSLDLWVAPVSAASSLVSVRGRWYIQMWSSGATYRPPTCPMIQWLGSFCAQPPSALKPGALAVGGAADTP